MKTNTKRRPKKKHTTRKKSKDTPWISNKIYTYGARGPIENEALFKEQLRDAHKFRNSMVELELSRRARRDDDISKLPGADQLNAIEVVIGQKSERLEALRDKKKQFNAKNRTKKKVPKSLNSDIKTLAARLKSYRERRKELRKQVFESVAWKSGEPGRKNWFLSEMRRRYNEAAMPSWGTAVRIQEETKLARKHPEPPRYKRWKHPGEGKIVVQLQGGLSVDDAMAGQDSRLRIKLVEKGIWVRGGRKKKPENPSPNMRLDKDGYPMRYLGNAWVRLRIASRNVRGNITVGGHTPVWITFPTIIHRSLPTNAKIKWAWLRKKVLGLNEKWEFQLVVAQDTRLTPPDPTAATTGSVAIDVGWRLISNPDTCGFEPKKKGRHLIPRSQRIIKHATDCPESDLRIAYWVGTDGQKGELRLPSRWVCAYYKVRDIDSIRKKSFNEMVEQLNVWIKSNQVPDWLSDAMKHSHNWKRQARLGKVTSTWSKKENRFDGDEEMFTELVTWNKQDKHLLDYDRNLRDQLRGWRKDIYRKFAHQLSRRYATVCLEDIDMRELAKRKAPEESHLEKDAARVHRSAAAISILRDSLKNKMDVVKVPAKGTSYNCNNCGVPAFVGNPNVNITCQYCGAVWDRDENAARNILQRGEQKSQKKAASGPAAA